MVTITCIVCIIVLLVCLNLPPWVRYLPGFAVMLGTQPGPQNINHQTYLRYVADQFRALGEGIYAYDAYEKKQVRVCRSIGSILKLSMSILIIV